MKIAVVFPGQGSQYVGMGKDILDNFQELNVYYDIASKKLGCDLRKIILEGPAELLAQTKYTQPSVFLTSFVIYKALLNKISNLQEKIGFFAGHSLGEYTAICAADVLNFEQTIEIVSIRAKIMQETSEKNPGSMIAVLGAEKQKIIEICKKEKDKGNIVEPVNFNCPGQVVVAGTYEGIEKLSDTLKKEKIKCIKLNVSGAFHSSLMDEAKNIFSAALDKLNLNNAFISIVMNVDAKPHNQSNKIKENLKLQINHPVLWQDIVEYISNSGIGLFIECGPGKVLSNLIKKINPNLKTANIENIETLTNTVNILKELQ